MPFSPQVHIEALEDPDANAASLLAGLLQPQARICPKHLYDAQGCALYGAICTLDEYYPTRTEAAIFARHRRDIAARLPRNCQWVDLGCGDGAKAFDWLEHVAATRYVGVDIAEDWLRDTLERGAKRFPDVEFVGIVTDFTRPLSLSHVRDSAHDYTPVLFYPGSSIGNFEPDEALALLKAMRQHLGRDGRLLIGVDAPKAVATLEAAYDDALGVTAAFNRNALRAVNRTLGASFEPATFAHRAVFDPERSRIEMHLVALHAQTVRLGVAQRRFEAGETIVTEHSYKYTPERFAELLSQAGFGQIDRFTDERGWFNVFLAAPAGALE
ncbi:L-histidine N(alpha)-methyltransferase [Chitiniphilus eburneus]|uniref:L-histidine N(Alpha)-methyltransferase n=1 Tax=Chitiniphilus eburneus TaxID=2571148 RepID=A0A4U0Q8R2_9NEIS|nr:L-histidine N(alpha)-methyltransferase [Chitiniphilus eburneus]